MSCYSTSRNAGKPAIQLTIVLIYQGYDKNCDGILQVAFGTPVSLFAVVFEITWPKVPFIAIIAFSDFTSDFKVIKLGVLLFTSWILWLHISDSL